MSPVYPPVRVANAIVASVRSPKPEIIVGGVARVMNCRVTSHPNAQSEWWGGRSTRTTSTSTRTSTAIAAICMSPVAYDGSVSGGWDGKKGLSIRRAATVGVTAMRAVWLLKNEELIHP
jgi:hypothetical protein